MKNTMTCKNCSFSWVDDGCAYPTCHYEPLEAWDLAPCEQEEADNYYSDVT